MRSESRFPGCARTEKPGKQTTTLSATRPGRGEETSAYLVKEGVVALAESTTHRILATHAHAISVAQENTHEKALDVTRKDAEKRAAGLSLPFFQQRTKSKGLCGGPINHSIWWETKQAERASTPTPQQCNVLLYVPSNSFTRDSAHFSRRTWREKPSGMRMLSRPMDFKSSTGTPVARLASLDRSSSVLCRIPFQFPWNAHSSKGPLPVSFVNCLEASNSDSKCFVSDSLSSLRPLSLSSPASWEHMQQKSLA